MAGGIYNSTNPAYSRKGRISAQECEPTFFLAADKCWERAIEGAELAGFDCNRIHLFAEHHDGNPGARPSVIDAPQEWKDLIASPEKVRNLSGRAPNPELYAAQRF